MNTELAIMNRIALLQSRPSDNSAIIHKLERKLRRIRNNNTK